MSTPLSLLPLIVYKKDQTPRLSVSFEAIKFLKSLKEKKVRNLHQ